MVNVQEKIESLESRVDKLEEEIKSLKNSKMRSSNISDNSESIGEIPINIIKSIEKIPTKDLILISLRANPNQTINDLEIKLKKMGWVEDTFFKKNFGSYLINKGLVQPSGKNEDEKKIFSLTMKGGIIAGKILEDLNNKFK